jgi:hypothetical protein
MMTIKEIYESNRQAFLRFCQTGATDVEPTNGNFETFYKQLIADGYAANTPVPDQLYGAAYFKLRKAGLIKFKPEPVAPKRGSRDQRAYEAGQAQTIRGNSPLEQNRDEEAAKERRKKEAAEASIKQAEKNREKTLERIDRHLAWVTSNRVGRVKTDEEKAQMRAELQAGWPGNQGLIDFSKWQSL